MCLYKYCIVHELEICTITLVFFAFSIKIILCSQHLFPDWLELLCSMEETYIAFGKKTEQMHQHDNICSLNFPMLL